MKTTQKTPYYAEKYEKIFHEFQKELHARLKMVRRKLERN